MKKILATLLSVLMIISVLPVGVIGITASAASGTVTMSLSIVDDNGNKVTKMSPGDKGWMAFSLSDYADAMGDTGIAIIQAFADINTDKFEVVEEDGKVKWATPYANIVSGGVFTSNVEDKVFSVIVETDNNIGATYSVSKAELDANNGLLFKVQMVVKADAVVGTEQFKIREKNNKAVTSIAFSNFTAPVVNCDQNGATVEIAQMTPATPKVKSVETTSSGVKVTWGKVSGADKYLVYRKTYNSKTKKWSGWSALTDKATSSSYTDKTAKSGTYYTYTVKAQNEAGYSSYTSGLKTYFLSTPKLSTPENANSYITVKWGKVTGASGYYVYRKTTGGWKKITTVKGGTKVSYKDATAKAGTTYKYSVRAYYSSYQSYYNTKGISIRRLTTPKLSSATSSKSGVTVKWGKVTGASGYYVYRKTTGGWKKITTVKGNSKITYLDKTAKKGITYKYTVKAYYSSSVSYYNTKGLTVKDKY